MINQKTAVITGATRGIGRALSVLLAESGDIIFAIGRNESALKDLCADHPENIIPVVADITNEDDRLKILAAIDGKKIDFLVNNVGMLTPLKSMQKYTELELRKIFDTNIIGPMLLTNLLISNLRGGKILNITTVAAEQAVENVSGYNITKAAVNMWTKALRLELKSENILAGYVIPGEVDTEMQGDLRAAPIDEFPLAAEFQEAAEKNTLISPAIVATFLSWILKQVPDSEFQTEYPWNIYTEETQKYWLPKGEIIPLPLNADKFN